MVERDFSKDRRTCTLPIEGPWQSGGGKFGELNIYAYPNTGKEIKIISDIESGDVAYFITQARTGWPAALEEIRRLQAEIKGLQFTVHELQANANVQSAMKDNS